MKILPWILMAIMTASCGAIEHSKTQLTDTEDNAKAAIELSPQDSQTLLEIMKFVGIRNSAEGVGIEEYKADEVTCTQQQLTSTSRKYTCAFKIEESNEPKVDREADAKTLYEVLARYIRPTGVFKKRVKAYDVVCSAPVILDPVVSCRLHARANVQKQTIKGAEATALFEAMAASGISDDQARAGAVTLNAQSLFCKKVSRRQAVLQKNCQFKVDEDTLNVPESHEADMFRLTEKYSAEQTDQRQGGRRIQTASLYEIECVQIVLPVPVTTCKFAPSR